jgi:hypothetical protein
MKRTTTPLNAEVRNGEAIISILYTPSWGGA